MNIIKKLTPWFSAYALLLLAAFLILIVAGNDFGGISLAGPHPFWQTVFFVNYTVFGNGLFAIGLAIFFIIYLRKKHAGYSLLWTVALSFLCIQLLKNIFYAGEARIFTEANQYLFLQDEAVFAGMISGYTVLAFAIATVLAFYSRGKYVFILLMPLAVLVAYSRMYLAQHSLPEVLLSSLAGMISGTGSLYVSLHGSSFRRSFAKMHGIKKQQKSNTGQVVHPA